MDINTAKTTVTNAITPIKECADEGMFMFTKLGSNETTFVRVGLIVKNVNLSSELNPVLDELKNMKTEFKTLCNKMANHFNDLKAFEVAQYFYRDIVVKASVLCKTISDTFDCKETESRNSSFDYFFKLYEKNSPLELAYTLRDMLENEVTNPLKKAMHADEMMTRNTFNQWKMLIGSVLTQLWLVECFACGMFNEENPYKTNKLKQEHEDFTRMADEWEKFYRTEGLFWPTKTRKMVQKTQDQNYWETALPLAVEIQTALRKVLTDDLFYIAVFPDTIECLVYSAEADQCLSTLHRGGFHIIVYRSRSASSANQETLEKMKSDVKEQLNITHLPDRKGMWFSSEQVKNIALRKIDSCGFLLIIRDHNRVAVESTKTDIAKFGPGWSDTGVYISDEGPPLKGENYTIVSGLP